MSLEHKAFIFDVERFSTELKPLLESSLLSGDVDRIRAFVVSNKSSLTDPYEGEPLEEDWEDMIEDKDVHQYGDFALTKYYSPTHDVGLGYDWEDLQKIFSVVTSVSFSPVLGEPLGRESEYFDPGKMGSYFQTSNQVLESLKIAKELKESVSDGMQELFDEFTVLLERAAREHKGLYVTF
jgi:hypothetical protein